jgi:hypothetical protein
LKIAVTAVSCHLGASTIRKLLQIHDRKDIVAMNDPSNFELAAGREPFGLNDYFMG